jgi:hypothetical protein
MIMSVQHRQARPGQAADATDMTDVANVRRLLEAHLDRIQHYVDTEKHADQAMLNGDVEIIPTVVALENRRDPGLNLSIALSPSELLRQIKTMPPVFHMRCVVRSSENTIHGAHHLYADIKREANHPLSILMIEPAHLGNNQNGRAMLLALLILMLPDAYFSGRRMSCFNVGAQMSGSDCLIFCIDFALKARRHEAEIAALHAIHFGGHAIGNDSANPDIDDNNADTLSVAPVSLLPFSFFEHAQSATALQAALGSDDPRVVEQVQQMQQRGQQHAQGVNANADNEKFAPSSIELRRRRFLLESLTALAVSDDQQQ